MLKHVEAEEEIGGFDGTGIRTAGQLAIDAPEAADFRVREEGTQVVVWLDADQFGVGQRGVDGEQIMTGATTHVDDPLGAALAGHMDNHVRDRPPFRGPVPGVQIGAVIGRLTIKGGDLLRSPRIALAPFGGQRRPGFLLRESGRRGGRPLGGECGHQLTWTSTIWLVVAGWVGGRMPVRRYRVEVTPAKTPAPGMVERRT